jgi:hypothetical protein
MYVLNNHLTKTFNIFQVCINCFKIPCNYVINQMIEFDGTVITKQNRTAYECLMNSMCT